MLLKLCQDLRKRGEAARSRLAFEGRGLLCGGMPDIPALNRKPWPMRRVIIAVVIFIVPYTWITFHFRKPNPAHLPYEDNKEQANVNRLLAEGYQRWRVEALLVRGEAGFMGVETGAAREGFPVRLEDTLVERPPMARRIVGLEAPAVLEAGEPWRLRFGIEHEDARVGVVGAEFFWRGSEVVVVPRLGRTGAAEREGRVELTLPAGRLPTGELRVHLVAEEGTRTWLMHVH